MSKADSELVRRDRRPDPEAAEGAIRGFLEALGFDPDQPALKDTPRRVREVFVDVLTSGYGQPAEAALGRGFATPGPTPLLAHGLPLLFTCPHHLTLAQGRVHVGIAPGARVPGLSRIGRLVDALSRRLVLQETLTEQLAEALYAGLDARAVAVIIEARHGCVALEDFARGDSRFSTQAQRGPAAASAELLTALRAGATHAP